MCWYLTNRFHLYIISKRSHSRCLKNKMRSVIVIFHFLTVASVMPACHKNQELLQSVQNQLHAIQRNVANLDCSHQEPNLSDKSDRVVFMAYNSKNLLGLEPKTTIKFDKVDLNEGQRYDPKTGIFKALSKGFYYFSWQIHAIATHACFTNLSVNGKPIAKLYTNAGFSNSSLDSSSSAVVHLHTGDEVNIRVNHGYGPGFAMHGDRWSNFNGFRIY